MNNFMNMRKSLQLRVSFLCILFLCAFPAFSEQLDGRDYFRKGRMELEAGRYADAVHSLQTAQREFPLLGDYATLYLSDAYHNLGEHGKALDEIRALILKNPQSPLLKKARAAEIREARETADGDLLKLLASFTRDYPEDEEMHMIFGLFLKQKGENAGAADAFKGIYLRAGVFSNAAAAELNTKDIKVADLIERAANLVNRYEFRDAEKDLRKALQMDNGIKKDEILRNLGNTLFRQKEYKEAAAVYEKANDLYSMARSLYRAGDKQGFDRALTSVLEKNDKRAGSLLLASAGDRRRAREYTAAVQLYTQVLDKFPAEEEDALWGIGWSFYLSAEYKKASEIFSRLTARHSDPKYLYWQARSIEALGEDPQRLYASMAGIENNFYAFLSRKKNGGKIIVPASHNEPAAEPAARQTWMERVGALLGMRMNQEAVFELTSASKKIESYSELLYIVSKFNELGEFKRAIGLATKIPYSEKIHRFWYPLAYWDEVTKITGKYGLDPLIVLSVMREESRFDADARSVAGARGLMQVMPQTAYRLDKSLKLGINKDSQVSDVKNNISLGVYYLKSLSAEFRSLAHVLAAYNAGEAAARRWEQEGRYRSIDEFIEDIPYPETRNYVKKVLTSYSQYRKSSGLDLKDAEVDLLSGMF
jgi:soluble lytic murein transglycosylase